MGITKEAAKDAEPFPRTAREMTNNLHVPGRQKAKLIKFLGYKMSKQEGTRHSQEGKD